MSGLESCYGHGPDVEFVQQAVAQLPWWGTMGLAGQVKHGGRTPGSLFEPLGHDGLNCAVEPVLFGKR